MSEHPITIRDRLLPELDRKAWLPLTARRELVDALGSIHIKNRAASVTPALRARVLLEQLCVQSVLPRWKALWPESLEQLTDLLRWTQMYLDGELDAFTLKVQTGKVVTLTDEYEVRAQWPARVALAVAGVARVARSGEVIADYGDDEAQLDMEDWDAGALAACIAARAAPSEPSEKHREFWRWYLTEAYPQAVMAAGIEPRSGGA